MNLPNEIWVPIFEHLPPKSLGCVVLTSRKFYAIAISLLYKNLILTCPTSFVAAFPVLSSIQTKPNSLILGISPLAFSGGRPVEQLLEFVDIVSFASASNHTRNPNNNSHLTKAKDDYQPRFLADNNLYTTILSQIASFTSLRELVFRGMLLPKKFHSIIHAFPHLRVLAIEHCTLPLSPLPRELSHTSLPIQSLSLLDIRFPGRPQPSNSDRPRNALRALATACTLRSLTYDHTIFVHCVFTPFTFANCPPLTALDVKFPIQKDRPRAPIGFIAFLDALPSLRTLILRNQVPILPMPLTALPALRALSAPLASIASICCGRNITKLDIRDEAVILPLYKAFEEAHDHLSNVEELSLLVGDWDDELILAIMAHFPSLTKLQVMYARGGPSEDTILGMGSRTLHALPNLTSVHMFRIPPLAGTVDANNRDDDALPYGAPGISDTLFRMHAHDSGAVAETPVGADAGPSPSNNDNDNDGVEVETATQLRLHMQNPSSSSSSSSSSNPNPNPTSNPHSPYADMRIIECYHQVAHGMSCDQCSAAMRLKCFERVTAVIDEAKSSFRSKREYDRRASEDRKRDGDGDGDGNSVMGMEGTGMEAGVGTGVEPFDEYTRELVIAWNRACPALRTVQLHPGWVWKRANPADYWAARPCQWGVWGDVFG